LNRGDLVVILVQDLQLTIDVSSGEKKHQSQQEIGVVLQSVLGRRLLIMQILSNDKDEVYKA